MMTNLQSKQNVRPVFLGVARKIELDGTSGSDATSKTDQYSGPVRKTK